MPRCLILGALLVVSSVGVTRSASASPVDDKRKEAQKIAGQIDALHNQSFDLGEEYDRVESELTKVDAEVAIAQKRVAALEAQVSTMRTAVQGFAVQSYIYGVQGEGSPRSSAAPTRPAVAAQREQYTELVLGSSVSKIDELETVSQDATQERQALESKQAQKRTLQKSLADKKAAGRGLDQEGQRPPGQGQGPAGHARWSRSRTGGRRRLRPARLGPGSRLPRRRPGATGGQRTLTAARSPAGASPRRRDRVPVPTCPRPRRVPRGAVAAAMSQLGVGYRYATAIPGVAFDCSGLTAWAWGQAGVGCRTSPASSSRRCPTCGQGDVQPGDLLFFYSPIGHVAMYIGNGQMVHATHPGDVVRVAGVSWDRVVGIGRP